MSVLNRNNLALLDGMWPEGIEQEKMFDLLEHTVRVMEIADPAPAPQRAAEHACAAAETRLATAYIDPDSAEEIGVAVALSDKFKDEFIDFMAANPNLEPPAVAEHFFVLRCLTGVLASG
jgi:hypothetical protein